MLLLSLTTPYIISIAIGYFLISFIKKKDDDMDPLIHFFLSAGIGLGVSSYLTFSSYLLFNQLGKFYVITLHGCLLLFLIGDTFFSKVDHRNNKKKMFEWLTIGTYISLIVLLVGMIPVWLQSRQYPFGGWDAWGVWNFKAKFLFTAGNKWENLLDPVLWRSSPHYPLLLPFMNVWGWIFSKSPTYHIPYWTGLIITFFSTGFLYSIIRHITKSAFSILPSLLLLSLPFYVLMSISQYSDLLLGYYILAGLYCLYEYFRSKNKSWGYLSALFLSFLSFTKPEGLIAAILILGLTSVLLINEKPDHRYTSGKSMALVLIVSFIFCAIPTYLFMSKYSPGNQTFINGLFSSQKPSDFLRINMILAMTLSEFINAKWNGIWFIIILGWLLGLRKSFHQQYRIIPLFLLSYIGIILLYYFINTHFEISWWVNVTLHRIFISLLPTILFWIMMTLWRGSLSSGANRQ